MAAFVNECTASVSAIRDRDLPRISEVRRKKFPNDVNEGKTKPRMFRRHLFDLFCFGGNHTFVYDSRDIISNSLFFVGATAWNILPPSEID